MNNYASTGLSRTNGNFLIGSLIAGATLLAAPQFPKDIVESPLRYGSEIANGSSFAAIYASPYSKISIKLPDETAFGDQKFEGAVVAFYDKLLNDQVSLGTEFEKILHDNLWILYEE